jgi:hypothetical protein
VLETVKARIKTDAKIYIHNDLSQGATYFHEVIEEKLRKGDREDIGFDGKACALMIAFASIASRATALISGHFLRGGAFLDQRTRAVDDVASAHSVLDDTSKQLPDCFRICRLGEEQPQSGFSVHDDSADRLVDFANRCR